MNPVLVFDTTHHALWAEEIAQERGLAVQVIPAPAEAHARCDLALETLQEELAGLVGALTEAGVRFRVHGRPAGGHG